MELIIAGVNKKIINFIGKWVSSWLDMICGLLSVITFTLYRPWWDFKFRCWFSKIQLKIRNNGHK